MSIWSPAAATGIGSMPGTDAREAMRIIAGELPELLHVVELPARGPGADMVGRTAGMLSLVSDDFATETTASGWRLSGGRGRDMRRAQSYLGEDLDVLEELSGGYAGPLKCQLTGPWTFAAVVELSGGERMLRDPSAIRDLAQAYEVAIAQHVAELRRRVPGATVLVQIDEPALPSVLQGRVGTASGLSTYAAVDAQDAERVLRIVANTKHGNVGVHCCASEAPMDLIRTSGFSFVSIDISDGRRDDPRDAEVGRIIESGIGLVAGTVPAVGDSPMSPAGASRPIRELLDRLGLADEKWLSRLAISPGCGLAGASPFWTRAALSASRSVGRVLRNDEESTEPGSRDG